MKLDAKALGLTVGLLWGVTLFGMTWWMIAFDGASGEPTLIGRFYRGYSVSPVGSLIGLAWALPDGFIGGVLIAWVYNFFAGRSKAPAAG